MTRRPKPRFRPGARVTLGRFGDSDAVVEYGVVVATFWDSFLETYDCYVAFFGEDGFPKTKEDFKEKPYVLRYLETSLKPYPNKKSKPLRRVLPLRYLP